MASFKLYAIWGLNADTLNFWSPQPDIRWSEIGVHWRPQKFEMARDNSVPQLCVKNRLHKIPYMWERYFASTRRQI